MPIDSRDGAVVRALASHQCVLSSIPRPGVKCGLSLLLVFFLAPRDFSSGNPVFLENQHFQFDLDYFQALYHEPLARVIAQAFPVTCNSPPQWFNQTDRRRFCSVTF